VLMSNCPSTPVTILHWQPLEIKTPLQKHTTIKEMLK
jgi:hypothetical protein